MSLFGHFLFCAPTRLPEPICPKHGLDSYLKKAKKNAFLYCDTYDNFAIWGGLMRFSNALLVFLKFRMLLEVLLYMQQITNS